MCPTERISQVEKLSQVVHINQLVVSENSKTNISKYHQLMKYSFYHAGYLIDEIKIPFRG
jgi:hypothetical protein